MLIIFSDGFSNVFGVCVYVRWKFNNGWYSCRFMLLKNWFVLIKKMFIDRIELCGVLLNLRLKVFLFI